MPGVGPELRSGSTGDRGFPGQKPSQDLLLETDRNPLERLRPEGGQRPAEVAVTGAAGGAGAEMRPGRGGGAGGRLSVVKL